MAQRAVHTIVKTSVPVKVHAPNTAVLLGASTSTVRATSQLVAVRGGTELSGSWTPIIGHTYDPLVGTEKQHTVPIVFRIWNYLFQKIWVIADVVEQDQLYWLHGYTNRSLDDLNISADVNEAPTLTNLTYLVHNPVDEDHRLIAKIRRVLSQKVRLTSNTRRMLSTNTKMITEVSKIIISSKSRILVKSIAISKNKITSLLTNVTGVSHLGIGRFFVDINDVVRYRLFSTRVKLVSNLVQSSRASFNVSRNILNRYFATSTNVANKIIKRERTRINTNILRPNYKYIRTLVNSTLLGFFNKNSRFIRTNILVNIIRYDGFNSVSISSLRPFISKVLSYIKSDVFMREYNSKANKIISRIGSFTTQFSKWTIEFTHKITNKNLMTKANIMKFIRSKYNVHTITKKDVSNKSDVELAINKTTKDRDLISDLNFTKFTNIRLEFWCLLLQRKRKLLIDPITLAHYKPYVYLMTGYIGVDYTPYVSSTMQPPILTDQRELHFENTGIVHIAHDILFQATSIDRQRSVVFNAMLSKLSSKISLGLVKYASRRWLQWYVSRNLVSNEGYSNEILFSLSEYDGPVPVPPVPGEHFEGGYVENPFFGQATKSADGASGYYSPDADEWAKNATNYWDSESQIFDGDEE